MSDATTPEGLDPKVTRRDVVLEVDTEHLEKMHHRASVHGFTFDSDEPASLGGESDHPYPLDYFAAGVGL